MYIITREVPTVIELGANETLILENLRTMELKNFKGLKAKIKVRVYSNFFDIVINNNVNSLYHSSSWSFKIV